MEDKELSGPALLSPRPAQPSGFPPRPEPKEAEGMISLDSERGQRLGFTSDRFDGWLWEDGERIWISFIESKQQGKGHLSELFHAIEAAGFYVAVPTPFPRMEAILRREGFEPHHELIQGDDVEVWYKPRSSAGRGDLRRSRLDVLFRIALEQKHASYNRRAGRHQPPH